VLGGAAHRARFDQLDAIEALEIPYVIGDSTNRGADDRRELDRARRPLVEDLQSVQAVRVAERLDQTLVDTAFLCIGQSVGRHVHLLQCGWAG